VAYLGMTGLCIALAAAWCVWAWWWPYKRCFRCRGRGKRGAGSTKYGYSRCSKCKGSGEQTRWTAQLISKTTGRPVRGSEEE
jgi:hypothetical protein